MRISDWSSDVCSSDLPVDRMRLELLRQPFMRAVGLCDDQQARSILVDAMNDAGARHAADSGESALAMMEQRIDQRPVQIARRRVDDQARGLVDDDQERKSKRLNYSH